MLDVNNVTKVFSKGTVNEHTALNNLSLHLDKGDFVTIVGSNGAGKSTLFNAVVVLSYVTVARLFLTMKILLIRKNIREQE